MAAIANDRFKIYYTEKLWELIPSVYRHEDGLPENPNPNVLRALVETIAEQAAILRRSQDQLWDDQFIELCNDWAVPYIGDLLGTRLLSALNKRGRRIDVAKTIYYRRRKGTPRVLEELIHDISEWDGKLVEGFKRLVRLRHGLDPLPAGFAGRFSGTPPGGLPDLRSASVSELADGPFEEYFHLPDVRKPRGLDGRYGINRLIIYLYRLKSYEVENATPFKINTDEFSFDPSGRAIHLFGIRNRPLNEGWDQWHSAKEWELPLPIRCRLLGHAEYKVDDEVIQKMLADGMPNANKTDLEKLRGYHFRSETELKRHTLFLMVNDFTNLLKHAIQHECGKHQLLPAALAVKADPPVGNPADRIIPEEVIASADLSKALPASVKSLLIDPVIGRFAFLNSPGSAKNVTVDYHYGFSGDIGAGTYERRQVEDSQPSWEVDPVAKIVDCTAFSIIDIVQIKDNSTYAVVANPSPFQDLVIQAANKTRPYLLLEDDLVFESKNEDATLILDGLWFGSPGNSKFNMIIKGDFECVTIRNCTFDPGGDDNVLNEKIKSVALIIEAEIEKLCIERSIMGPVITRGKGLIDDDEQDGVFINDCIVQSDVPAKDAIAISTGKTSIRRTTVFGATTVHRLEASDSLFTGVIKVTDTQAGCFRFSAAPQGVQPNASRLPAHPYESFIYEKDSLHWFTSKKFGHHGFAQLSETAPVEIYRGGENGAEMGAFNSLLNAIKYDGIRAKLDEYMPFGLIPAFVNET